MGKIIGLTYDLRTDYKFRENDPPDANAEFDHPQTIDLIARTIESLGHKCLRIGNVDDLLKKLDNLKVDIVFNISEGSSGRNRESQVPIILEMMHIPFVGSDGLTLGLSLDKAMTKKILISENIPTPKFFETDDPTDNIAKLRAMKFPLIVKPRCEGSSKGLSEKSRVENIEQLREQIGYIVRTYKQSALVEEFIAGRELNVTIIGNNSDTTMLPISEIVFGPSYKREHKWEIVDFDAKWKEDSINFLETPGMCPPALEKGIEGLIEDLAIRAYHACNCRDFARIDLRLTPDNRVYFLEVNLNPGIGPEDGAIRSARASNYTYGSFLKKLIYIAAERYSS